MKETPYFSARTSDQKTVTDNEDLELIQTETDIEQDLPPIEPAVINEIAIPEMGTFEEGEI